MKYSYTLLLFLVALSANAQISFSNQTTLLNNPTGFKSGVAVGIADMNADGLDDIVRLGQANMLSIEYQGAPNQPFANYTHGNVPGDAWAMVVGDVNNDGYNDIFAGGAYDGVKILTNNGGSSFTTAILPQDEIFVQGSNFADINNDGWLDVFACHDDGEARIWGNSGDGTFLLHDEWIDMSTTPISDNSGNYGSVWTDFDNDRDLDLYIAKCRQGVDDPTDPRRINALFVNDGHNNFTELAGKYGLKIGWQSWTSDFQDIDNDGDMDCLVTNHDYALQLLLNDGTGRFTDIATAAGVAVMGNFIQGIMRDFDNDGFVDIITVGNFSSSTIGTNLFHNNGDLTFTKIVNPFGATSIGTLATGDLNADGFLDIYAAYQTSFNNPSNIADKLWMNTSNNNGNNYIAFDLKGLQSNKMGVGARLEIHGSWGIQIREVRSGESYGIQNSLTQYFGIGTETEVEYVVVHWPSGKMDVLKNPAINQKHIIEEGTSCSLDDITIGNGATTILCAGESVVVSAPAGFAYLWSNGLVSESLNIEQPGNYSVVVIDAQGCAAESNILSVEVSPDETPIVTAQGPLSFCAGESVTLSSTNAAAYTWSNGETTQAVTVNQSGTYSVSIQGVCGDFASIPIEVEVLPAPAPTAENVTLLAPGSAILEAVGDNIVWYDSPLGNIAIGAGATFSTPIIATADTFYVADVHLYNEEEFVIGMAAHQGSIFFNGSNFNGHTMFETLVPLVIEQVTVYAETPGIRIIELTTESGTLLETFSFDVQAGKNDIPVNFQVPMPGFYRLRTNADQNEATLGTLSPQLYRSNQGVSYPYEQADLMSIYGSDLGSGFYYYFYDWKISTIPTACPSERVQVIVTVMPSSSTEAQSFGKLVVSPNPSAGQFMVEMEAEESGNATINVADVAGRLVLQQAFETTAHVAQRQSIDMTGMPAGIYFLKITSGERSGYAKLVKE